MLSYETERRLKNYLTALAEGELGIESLRQRLAQICDFSPCMAFQRVDRDANENVTSYELYNFLRENGVFSVSEGELYRLVKFFDNNEDGRLSFTEFEQILLPCEDNCLRRLAQDRRSYRVARYENLPLDIERGMTAILEAEVELLRRLDLLKRELEVRYDFSPYACFKTVDRYNEGFINAGNLTIFLRSNGFYPTERENLAIIRRMDTSCISKINFGDFSDFLRAQGSAESASSSSSSTQARSASAGGRQASRPLVDRSGEKARSQSSMRTRTTGKKSPGSPKKPCCDDCARTGGNCQEERRCEPLCRRICCYDPCRPLCYPCYPECLPSYCRPVECRPICPPRPCLSSSNEYELVKALYDIIREERDLESSKLNLARRSDFNFYDAFKIFDTSSKGYITLADLRDGLAAIGVFPTTSDMELYIRRYDKFNERKVRFSDFCESFTPQTDSYYSASLNRRRSNYWASNGRASARDDCFEAGTRVEFRALWNTHFKVEAMCEGIRQRLRALPCFDLYNAFLTCDLYSDGVITRDELRRFIDCRGFCVTDTDAKQLADKMDRDNDGRVSYCEVSTLSF